MESNELNNKIIKNVRNKIVVSALEREESMKIEKRKQVISLCAVMLVIFSGGFMTVNAATNGKVVEEIKDFIQINYDQSKYKIVGETDTIDATTGEEHVVYEVQSNDGQEEFLIDTNKTVLEKENLEVNGNIKFETQQDNEASSTFEMTIQNKK